MDTTIITALISAAATLCVCLVNNHYLQKTAEEKHAVTIALIESRLTELTRQVAKHNSIIERTFQLEKSTGIIQEQIKVINHRITDLEDDNK